MRLAGTIILYNENKKVLSNINTYINDLSVLYVIDNSDKINTAIVDLLRNNPKIKYHWNHGNKGIAYALNYAAKRSIKDGYDWLILFDQDSYALPCMIHNLLDFISNHDIEKIGIVSAYQKINTEKQLKCYKEYEFCDLVITSGSTINLNIYQKVGKFDEKLFIDMVDHEYCLRLKEHGFKIVKITRAILSHEVGRNKTIRNHPISLHSYTRIYYFVRNILIVKQRYGEKYPNIVNGLYEEVLKRCRNNLIYGNHRFRQIIYIGKGFYDYKMGNLGKMK